MFTSHYRGLRESLLDYCSKLVHKPLHLLFSLSHCSCVILSSSRRLFTFSHVAHFTAEHPSSSQSAEAAADVSSNTPTTPRSTNGQPHDSAPQVSSQLSLRPPLLAQPIAIAKLPATTTIH
jgi:hypothetical protein